jgi:hypothetical protein
VNYSRRFQHSLCLVAAILALTLTSGCNMFSPFSTPSGDEQIISSCRAKFDDGDFQGAIQCYGQVSSANQDIAISESAYAQLAEQGASMENYAAAFGKGNVDIGPAITKFAEGMIVGAGQTRRVAIFNAFATYQQLLPINPNLAYLVQFLGALSFGAEILAEEGSTAPNGNPTLSQADLNTLQLTGSPSGSLTNLISTPGQINTSPATYDMLNAALLDVASAVASLGTQGSFSSSTIDFAQAFKLIPAGQTTLYVQALISQGVGETGN